MRLKNYILFILAIVALIPIAIYGIMKHIVINVFMQKEFDMDDYMFQCAYRLDIVGGYIIYTEDGHTMSALAWKNKDWHWIVLISVLFMRVNHCREQYMEEYEIENNVYQDEYGV